ncbi:Fic/DOC family protein [Curtobacterium sp. L1-20]|uniref:Fic/DOC family protein n=1 Tax=Curtobacterium sp. L1-20 TaxID=3138181 RepID=UPI003B51D491
MSVDDKYTYPGSGGVLVNAAGYRTHEQLDEAMNEFASVTMAEVRAEPVPSRPDYEYLQRIHDRMFGDLVPGIAGQIRDVDVQATGTGIPYCRPEYIDANLSTLFGKLEREDYLTGLDADTFADRLADRWGELSAIHPFRDGNTRSQSAYVGAVAERAGHPIAWERVDVDELRTVRLHAIAGNDRPLADYLRAHLVERDEGRDERGFDAFERRDRDMMRSAGLDPDAGLPKHPGAGASMTEQWPTMPEQFRGHDGIER